jgi:hypothetical protein
VSRKSIARKRAEERAARPQYDWYPIQPGPAERPCETCGETTIIQGLKPAGCPDGLSVTWRTYAPCGHPQPDLNPMA